MQTVERKGPHAPKDPVKKRPFFFIMQGKEIFGAPTPDGRGIQFIYENNGRLIDSARIAGNVSDESMLELLKTTDGFRKMVHGIGVSVSSKNKGETVKFVFQMYAKNPGEPSTEIVKEFVADGMENMIDLSDVDWVSTDHEPGQIRFEFAKSGSLALADVRFYLNDGYVAPQQPIDEAVDFGSAQYATMIKRSLMQLGNTQRLERVLEKAAKGEDVTLGFIGGSITQGAGAIPIHEKSYARVFADRFEKKYSNGGKVDLVKAGVGGTPSELGMIRFERDILRDGTKEPDLIVIEFAVNDEDDETKGVCYESLARKAFSLPWKPAVVLLFAVFSFDWNLQERLGPVGERYYLPMVSVMDAVTPQFTLMPAEGRVISKNQFFYDVFHPSNLGHQIMADCLINLMDEVNSNHGYHELEEKQLSKTKPVIGGDFEKVELIDKKELPRLKKKYKLSILDEGCFDGLDEELQGVELDSDVRPTPEFPHNWAHTEVSKGKGAFKMQLTCSKLLLVFKDSDKPAYGKAEVLVDGNKVLELDPLKVGWTHCHAIIVFNEKSSKSHVVEVQMAEGDENKKFTILGFGVVE